MPARDDMIVSGSAPSPAVSKARVGLRLPGGHPLPCRLPSFQTVNGSRNSDQLAERENADRHEHQDLHRRRGWEAASKAPWGARWGAILNRHKATQRLLKRSITSIKQSSSYHDRRQSTDRVSFVSKFIASVACPAAVDGEHGAGEVARFRVGEQ